MLARGEGGRLHLHLAAIGHARAGGESLDAEEPPPAMLARDERCSMQRKQVAFLGAARQGAAPAPVSI